MNNCVEIVVKHCYGKEKEMLLIYTVVEGDVCQGEALHERTEKWLVVIRLELFSYFAGSNQDKCVGLQYFVNNVCLNIIINMNVKNGDHELQTS